MKIIDISTTLHENMPIYPGNAEFEVEQDESSTSYISTLKFGSHTGTHMDAPAHAFEDGEGVDEIELERCMGECRVLDMTHIEPSSGIEVGDIKDEQIETGDRILFKTQNSSRGYDEFYKDFVYLESGAAKFLAEKSPALVGIDYLSVKKKGRDDNTAHTAFLSLGIPIIEGLDLSKVQPGEYELVALPLKLKGLDASPVRAILKA
ncbi:MAG: cyclase family protein [Candidatus Magasanikbacteria bacterium]